MFRFLAFFVLFLNLCSADTGLVGTYRLTDGASYYKDGSKRFDYSMGKVVITQLENGDLLILRAITPKGHSTLSEVRIVTKNNGIWFHKTNKGKITKQKYLVTEKDGGFIEQQFYKNGSSISHWKLVGPDEKKNKYLEAKLKTAYENYESHWAANFQ